MNTKLHLKKHVYLFLLLVFALSVKAQTITIGGVATPYSGSDITNGINGTGWEWSGTTGTPANTLTLHTGYNGEPVKIEIPGDVTLKFTDDITINATANDAAIYFSGSNLNIVGDGSHTLTVIGENLSGASLVGSYSIILESGNLTIDNAKIVTIGGSDDNGGAEGIFVSDGSLSIINNSEVEAMGGADDDDAGDGIHAVKGIIIDNSTVIASGGDNGSSVSASPYGGQGINGDNYDIHIRNNSDVTVKGSPILGSGIVAAAITITDSKIDATSSYIGIGVNDDKTNITANDLTITRSEVTAQGGVGIYVSEGNLLIEDNSTVDTKGDDGAEGIIVYGKLTINSSTLNAQGGDDFIKGEAGAGIEVKDGDIVINNSKVTSHGGAGGTKFGDGIIAEAGKIVITNQSVVIAYSALLPTGNLGGIWSAEGYNISGNSKLEAGGSTGGIGSGDILGTLGDIHIYNSEIIASSLRYQAIFLVPGSKITVHDTNSKITFINTGNMYSMYTDVPITNTVPYGEWVVNPVSSTFLTSPLTTQNNSINNSIGGTFELTVVEGTAPPTPPTPPAIKYYDLTIPCLEGVVCDPLEGYYSVSEETRVVIKLTAKSGYLLDDVALKVNGRSIYPKIGSTSTEATFVIGYLSEDIVIDIEGVKRETPTSASQALKDEFKVYTAPGAAVIFAPTGWRGEALIYSTIGVLQARLTLAEGVNTVFLPKGLYIVSTKNKTFKVFVR